MLYEQKKHSGELPIIGVNTYLNPRANEEGFYVTGEQARATKEEKDWQIANLRAFRERNSDTAPSALQRLQEIAVAGGNIFAELMETVKYASPGQISHAL